MISEEVLVIMTWIEVVLKAICILFGIATACAITLPKLKKAIKKRNAATTDAEKAKAESEIKAAVLDLIVVADEQYSTLNTALKSIGESGAGKFKKENVLNSIRDFCDEKGYEYDKQDVSDYIDKVIDLTKKVN